MEDADGAASRLRRAPLLATDEQQQDGGRPSSALTIVGEDVEAAPGKVATDGAASPQQRPAASSVLWSVCPFILVAETCTRLSYYGLAGSLVLLFQSKLGLSNSEADNHYAVWSGLCYCTPLIGGWLADTHWGRFRTIATCSCIYLLGLLLLIITVWPGGPAAANNGASASALIFTAIYIVAAGDGGVKPNVCTFGADQFDRRVPEQRRELESFFGYFYWAINIGALISFSLVASIAQFGVPWLGGKDYRFVVGFAIPALATAMAITIFLSGGRRYKKNPPKGSIITTATQVIAQATWATLRGRRQRRQQRREGALLDGEAEGEEGVAVVGSWLDRAKRAHGGSFAEGDVEGVKYVCRLLPFLLFLMPYWACYTQMSTTMQNQACVMDLSLGQSRIAVSTLNLFDTLAIIFLIPVFDRGIYPALKKRGYALTPLQKFGAGFGFAILAMLVAGCVEAYRKAQAPPPVSYPTDPADAATIAYLREYISACRTLDDYNPFQYQQWYASNKQQQGGSSSAASGDPAPANCRQVGPALPDGTLPLASIACDNVPLVSPVSVFLQVPQFLLVGISEILTSVTSYEFFYSQAPGHMRSFTQSLNLLTTALGTWLCIPIVYLANANPDHQLVPADLNTGYLASFFFMLAGLMVLDLLGFAWAAKGYKYVEIEDGEEGDGEVNVIGQDEETVLLHDPVGAAASTGGRA